MIGLKHLSEDDLTDTKIEVQVTKIERREITDIELNLENKFHIIVESKIADRSPEEKQLRKYAERLSLERKGLKRLALLTEKDETYWYEQCFNSNGKFHGLNKEEYVYIRWNQISDIVFQRLISPKISSLNKMFIEYMERIFMPEEILIVAVNSQQEFDILENHHFYRFPVEGAFPKKKAMYLAVYYKGIEHIAKIIEYKVMKPKDIHPLPELFPEDYGPSTDGGEADFYKVVIGPLIKLPLKITNPRGHRIAYRYTTFDKLLTAKYIHDL
jgi:hypothetical protein